MDFRDFAEKKTTEPADKSALRWWEEKDATHAAQSAWTQQATLEMQQNYRAEELIRFARLYGNRNLSGLGLGQYARSVPGSYKQGTSQNVIRSVIDTVVAMTCAARPRPSYLTQDGDFDQREKAKLLNKFTRGQFYEAKYYDVAPTVATDSCVFGTGVIKSLEIDGRVRMERTYVGQLWVDEAESIFGNPRQMYQAMPIARDILRAMFPKAKEGVIDKAKKEETAGILFAGDMVRVVEAWHLESGKGVGDGKHLICTSEGVLGEVEDWMLPYFPFSFLRWADPQFGFWGTGIAEQLLNKQLAINKLAMRMDRMLHFSTPRVLVQRGSKIPKNHFTNDVADIVEFDGPIPPTVMNPVMIPADYFKRMEDMKREAFEEIGLSQSMAGGNKDPGIVSKVALRERSDIQSARFVRFGQKYEQLSLDVGRQQIQLTREVAKRTEEGSDAAKGYEVTMPDKKFLEKIDWNDIALEEDQYVMQAFPVSSLPSTPAARQETVAEWVEQGWVSQEEGRMLLDFPDLEHSTNLAVAALQDIDRTIDHMLSGKGYLPPDPHQNLQLGIQRCLSAYLRARTESYPPDRLEALQNWILQAQDQLNQAAAANVPGAPPPGAPPEAAPAPEPGPQAPPMPPGMAA
jgi:hypothetical protein